MRRSRVVALFVVGVLVGSLASVVSVGAEENPDEVRLPPGTVVYLGEITEAHDTANHNFLTGPKIENFPDVEYLDLAYAVVENEFEVLKFPDGNVVGEGKVVFDIETRTRTWWAGGGQWVEAHTHFRSTVSFSFEASPIRGESSVLQTEGSFEIPPRGIEVFVNEVSVGEPSPIPPGPSISGLFGSRVAEGRGALEAGFSPFLGDAWPGFLRLDAVPVYEQAAVTQGGLLRGEGPHGIDVGLLGGVLGGCEGEILVQIDQGTNTEPLGDMCARLIDPERWGGTPAESAEKIVRISLVLRDLVSPADGKQALFPTLGSSGVLRVMGVLAEKVKADPDDARAMAALVTFLNFNLRINGACAPGSCPA